MFPTLHRVAKTARCGLCSVVVVFTTRARLPGYSDERYFRSRCTGVGRVNAELSGRIFLVSISADGFVLSKRLPYVLCYKCEPLSIIKHTFGTRLSDLGVVNSQLRDFILAILQSALLMWLSSVS